MRSPVTHAHVDSSSTDLDGVPAVRRRTVLAKIAAGVAATVGVSGAFSQARYPSRPITLVVTFPPGGISDVYARVLGQGLTAELGQPVIVENRAGASGTIGVQSVARANPDGYTLVLGGTSTYTIAPFTVPALPYDPIQDFAPISTVGQAAYVLMASSRLKANSLKELIAIARAKPMSITMGTAGDGTIYDLGAQHINKVLGIQLLRVPYKGLAPAMQDLLGGQIDTVLTPPDANAAFTARARPLAILSSKRAAAHPDIPTTAELGFPELTLSAWSAVFAPAKTPVEIVNQLSQACQAILRQPDVRAKLMAAGLEAGGSDPQALAAMVQRDLQRSRDLFGK